MLEWLIAILIATITLMANCIFGFYLAMAGPPAAPHSTAERWYIALFGLQAVLALKVGEYWKRGTAESFKVMFFTCSSILVLVIIVGLIERMTQARVLLFTFGPIGVYAMSVAAAILLRPHVVSPSR